MTNNNSGKHLLNMKDRETLDITGIEEVITFNENKIILKTNLGRLDIMGNDLNIKKLNLEESNISITGYIDSIEYNEKPVNSNIFKRIFK